MRFIRNILGTLINKRPSPQFLEIYLGIMAVILLLKAISKLSYPLQAKLFSSIILLKWNPHKKKLN